MSQESAERVRPPLVADEATMLAAWLDWHRETLARKVSGVDPVRVGEATAAPSTLTLLGLVRHMADNERYWFREVVAGETVGEYWAIGDDGDEDLLGAHPDGPEADVAEWRRAVAESRAVLAGRSMDDLTATVFPKGRMSLRWVVVHMIEEYARHNGHADLLRERLDGVVGGVVVGEMTDGPDDLRVDPPFFADEAAMLTSWLEWHRGTLARKVTGVPLERLAERTVPPSSLSLLGLVRHLAEVERSWFRRVLAGQDAPPIYYSDASPDGDIDDTDGADPAADLQVWRAEVAHARTLAAGLPMDTASTGLRHGEHVSLRWILVHMIEEYARHNGHADLLRERLDGVVGE